MKINQLHSWNVTTSEAKVIQLKLKEKIQLQKLNSPIKLVAGADVSYSKKVEMSFAAITVFKFPEMEIVEQKQSVGAINFPYVPGYLTFREAPILLEAFEKLEITPDLLFFDGQGIAHPRQMGLAAHLGVILDLPSIGCAKSLLVGNFDEPEAIQGSWSELSYRDKVIGAVVRTRDCVKPLFVSPGFKITIDEAIEWVLRACTKYRIPDPIRCSHIAVNQLRVKYEN
jgi:deoxyribonuclease V